jgi:hypothetical protein
MSTVKKALDIQTGKFVAVKFLDISSSGELIGPMFRNEVESLKSLKHLNIAKFIESSEPTSDQLVIVTEWIERSLDPVVEKAVLDMAIEYPAYGQLRVSNELKREGIMVSPGGVRSIWLRNDLNNLKKRLKALEIKMAQDGIVLTESQLQALERRKETSRSCSRTHQGECALWYPRTPGA